MHNRFPSRGRMENRRPQLLDNAVVRDGLTNHSRGTPHPSDEYRRTVPQTNQRRLGVSTA
jgi:hypothetical protein